MPKKSSADPRPRIYGKRWFSCKDYVHLANTAFGISREKSRKQRHSTRRLDAIRLPPINRTGYTISANDISTTNSGCGDKCDSKRIRETEKRQEPVESNDEPQKDLIVPSAWTVSIEGDAESQKAFQRYCSASTSVMHPLPFYYNPHKALRCTKPIEEKLVTSNERSAKKEQQYETITKPLKISNKELHMLEQQQEEEQQQQQHDSEVVNSCTSTDESSRERVVKRATTHHPTSDTTVLGRSLSKTQNMHQKHLRKVRQNCDVTNDFKSHMPLLKYSTRSILMCRLLRPF